MTITAIVLVLISAFTHVGWNVLGKRNHPTAGFLLVATLFGCLSLSPSLLFFGRALAVFPATVWVCLGITGIFQALYYVALAGAYRTGDMSVVYPLARSVPVAIVACVSVLLGRRAHLIDKRFRIGTIRDPSLHPGKAPGFPFDKLRASCSG